MSEKPIIFISCGQSHPDETELGREVCALVKKHTPCDAYFAQNQSDLAGLEAHILDNLNRCAGLIAIMHPRGEVILPNGSKIARASVWIEQEIAIAAFLNNQMKRSLRIAAYVHKDVALEGLRQFIILNPKKFESSEDILNDLPSTLSSWNDFPKEGEDSLERFRDICASKKQGDFGTLIESMRDQLIERWNEIDAYDDTLTQESDPREVAAQIQEHKVSVFVPAMRRLTILGLAAIKAGESVDYLRRVVTLLQEVYESCDRLRLLRIFSNKPAQSDDETWYISNTMPAFEALVSLQLMGAYLAKRDRFEYLSALLTPLGNL